MSKQLGAILVLCLSLSVSWLSFAFCQQRGERPDRFRTRITERWLNYTQLEFRQGARSWRLDAMGGVTIPLEDEYNHLNLYDFAGNVAGLWADRDRTHTDLWFERYSWENDATMTDRYSRLGGSSVYRGPNGFAIGGYFETADNSLSSDYWTHDFEELEWALDRITPDYFEDPLVREEEWPLPDSICSGLICSGSVCTFDSSFTVSSKYYDVGGMVNYKGSMISVGAKAFFKRESEERSQEVRYVINDSYDEPGLSLGLGVQLSKTITLAANVDYSKVTMQGVSDGLADTVEIAHYDVFDYERPVFAAGAQVAVTLDPSLKGIIAYRHESWSGDETFLLDWVNSEVYPQGGGGIQAEGKTFEDSYSSWEGSSRWLFELPGAGFSFGALGRLGAHTYERTLEPDTLTAQTCRVRVDSLDVERTHWRFGGGLAQRFGTKILVAAQFEVGSTEEIDAVSEAQIFENGVWKLSGGVEYGIGNGLTARAGYGYSVIDPSTSNEDDTYHGTKMSVGLNYVPVAPFPIQLDLLYTRLDWTKDGDRTPVADASSNHLALYGRVYF